MRGRLSVPDYRRMKDSDYVGHRYVVFVEDWLLSHDMVTHDVFSDVTVWVNGLSESDARELAAWMARVDVIGLFTSEHI